MTASQDPAQPVPRRPAGPGARGRHRPRLVPFLATGAVLGSLLGLLLVVFGPDAESAGTAQETIILGGIGALLGGLVGGIVYLLVERYSLR